ncbi:uncharacterized protein LOC103870816 [Brassica rapa]|uniref:Transmembrane protein n=1 Tax=Brassica campestris TaxID=3711 RepID=M4FEB1_BRACM|nr:uncharacterized protein LOC103870816 [Brassica rapa]
MVNRTPDNPVVIRGFSAPGLALFFGFTGYMIWQIVENTRITKATKKCTEYLNEACLRNTRVSEGYKEISRLIGKEKDEADDEAEAEAEAEADDEDEDEDESESELSGKKVE